MKTVGADEEKLPSADEVQAILRLRDFLVCAEATALAVRVPAACSNHDLARLESSSACLRVASAPSSTPAK
jgi:hypothetical protein